MTAQLALSDWQPPSDDGAPPTRGSFDGSTYSRAEDMARLNSVMASVWRQLRTGRVFTLPELHAAVEQELGRPALITSISSKARDLRKPQKDAWPVRCERRAGGTWVVWMGQKT